MSLDYFVEKEVRIFSHVLIVLSSLRLQLYLGLLTLAGPAIKEERLTVKRGLAASIPRGRTNTEGLKITEK